MKILVIEQDLRVSGTSQGIISRSFLYRLRNAHPKAVINVVYLKSHPSDDQLHLLPVDHIESHILNLKVPFFTKLINRFYWRLFHVSLVIEHINKVYGACIAKIEYQSYDHIFVRSAGLAHETILGCKDLPILKKAIVNFHDPYPIFWYAGTTKPLTNLELFQMKSMQKVVSQAKTCMSSATAMAKDMQFLYGSRKKFYSLPHQYCESVFDLSDTDKALKKGKPITIAYHGAIQFGRTIENLLDAYETLVHSNPLYSEKTEFILRLKGIDLKKLAARYSNTPNIIILDTLNFSNSCYEQTHVADINIILENGPLYCNILVGKAPFLASSNKPVLCISPPVSELRSIINDEKYIAAMEDKLEIQNKLEQLILSRVNNEEPVYPFGDYFNDVNFKSRLNEILEDK